MATRTCRRSGIELGTGTVAGSVQPGGARRFALCAPNRPNRIAGFGVVRSSIIMVTGKLVGMDRDAEFMVGAWERCSAGNFECPDSGMAPVRRGWGTGSDFLYLARPSWN